MAIEKNNFKVSRFDSEFPPGSRESVSSDEDELQRRSPAIESDDDDDEFDDADSGAGSDDFDLLELGETGAEFCQIGNLTCSVPFELYDLFGLEDILSVDVWNECLSEQERFSLTKYLPDLDQETYMCTLKDLFTSGNFHFGSPVKKLFDMLKGGLCEPRVALYREGFNFFQKRQHYHLLRNHQNNMVSYLCQMRDAWLTCKGYSIEEKLRILNIMRSQKSLMYEKKEFLEADSSGKEESGAVLWSKRVKDRRAGQKLGYHPSYEGSNLELPLRGQPLALEGAKHGKQNPKGTLKLAGSKTTSRKELMDHYPHIIPGLDMNSGPYGSAATLPGQNKALGYNSGSALRMRDQLGIDDDAGDQLGGMNVTRDRNVAHGSLMDISKLVRAGKKRDILRSDELATDSFMALPFSSRINSHAHGRNKNADHQSEMKLFLEKQPHMRYSYDLAKKAKYPEKVQRFAVGDQMRNLKGRTPHLAEPFWHDQNQGEMFSADSSFKLDDWNVKSKKWKTGRESPDLNFKPYSEFRAKSSQEKMRRNLVQNGGPALRGNRMFVGEETESESSEQLDDVDDDAAADDDDFINPMMRSSYPSVFDSRKGKITKANLQENAQSLDGAIHFSKKKGGFSGLGHMSGAENYLSKAKQKGKIRDSSPRHISAARVLEGNLPSTLDKSTDDVGVKYRHKVGKSGQLRGDFGAGLHMSSLKTFPPERRSKREFFHGPAVEEEDDSLEELLTDDRKMKRPGKKEHSIQSHTDDRLAKSEASLLGCNSVTKKRKARGEMAEVDGRGEVGNMQANLHPQFDNSTSMKKKGKRKSEIELGATDMTTSEAPATEMGVVEVELETKPQKKPYTPITPTVHSGFSFSIIHLLSAIRMAMITPLPEDLLEIGKIRDEQNRKHEGSSNGVLSQENMVVGKSDNTGQSNAPSLTVHEIENRVRSNPGDPCILETQEPLQDLVRGVLKIFSSKTAPLGAKGWRALVAYEKSTKNWSWICAVSHSSSDHDSVEEVTSPEAWGLPHKMLVKLVDAFANWLKSGQETLQQIGSLPAPPLSLMQCKLDEQERFRDVRAQKSQNTISPSSEEVRAYFRKEEFLRYSIPDRAFSYTAADGKKSIVAPLRRCGGKPTSKARDHFMLKRDRPPHVTILCLVRDAAARLPGSIGTRADVCTLIRDSQYIVEDVSDTQVNQVVSGALDRLHYERDPCVQYDSERKLWVYLHREREEEDFEDDGTSSTKKWKRQKRDPADQQDQTTVTVAYHDPGDQSGFDLHLNVDPGIDDDKGVDAYNDARQIVEDNVDTGQGSQCGNLDQGQPMIWEGTNLNPTRENKSLCQENSANEDLDDETFGRERSVGLLSASLL
ncbi:hypothetical protein HS088_TW07G00239 [Tripterygium wilfordii]|uniref:DEUBAD domain-containing protein n=1 Tax=Tripterygium wilfordii TaxID=458696 RepID=A0A7J7DEB0_TRIWF|nr:uncharacterized protein LOC120002210 [Tripterygium wilfordii]KAF5744662.1 hypothetical protein HS088_TW07G00239 [Tripterygium wilfordii]